MPAETELAASPAYERYDFHQSRRIAPHKMRTMEAMHERLAHSLEAWLTGRLRKQMAITLKTIAISPFRDFTKALAPSCACFGFAITNVEGHEGVVDISNELAYLLVDRFFGGDSLPAVMDRGMTPIERLTVRIAVERITTLVAEIWQDYVPLHLDLTSFESDPEMVQTMRREDEVLVTTFEAEADQIRSTFRVCLPLVVLEKFFGAGDRRRGRAAPGMNAEHLATREITEATVRKMRVEVAVRLPSFDVPMRQLLEMPPGTVLATGLSTETKLEVFVGDTPRYRATPGRVGQRVAVRVLDSLQSTPMDRDASAHSSSGHEA